MYTFSAREKIVGWYHTGPKLNQNDVAINELMRRYCPNSVSSEYSLASLLCWQTKEHLFLWVHIGSYEKLATVLSFSWSYIWRCFNALWPCFLFLTALVYSLPFAFKNVNTCSHTHWSFYFTGHLKTLTKNDTQVFVLIWSRFLMNCLIYLDLSMCTVFRLLNLLRCKGP